MECSTHTALFPPSLSAETLARRTIDALRAGNVTSAVEISQYLTACFPNLQEGLLLNAVALSQAGEHASEAALQAWDEVLRRNPLQAEYLMQALRLAWDCKSTKYAESWFLLLCNVFLEAPPFLLLQELEARGQSIIGSVGIHGGTLRGWTWQNLDSNDSLPQFFVEAGSASAPALHMGPIRRLKSADRVLNIFSLDLPKLRGSYTIRVTDAQGRPLHGSPVVVSCPDLCFQKPKSRSSALAVIIPVYADRRATLACIGSVLASRKANRTPFEIVTVWDHGPDVRLLANLQSLAARGLCTLHEAPYNMGFLGAVNYGLERHHGQSIVLLNADTLVCADWLDRLHRIGSRLGVGTVTPFGTHAELLSFPKPKAKVSVTRLQQVRHLDAACSKANAGVVAQNIPVGVGFCMYISRKTLDTIGGLDGHALFRGYGEEVEYCLRAKKHNLRNVAACNVFVGHVGERSFGVSKIALAKQNNVNIFAQYPEYNEEYDKFMAADSLRHFQLSAAKLAIQPLAGPLHVASALDSASPELLHLEKQGGDSAVLLLRPCGKRTRAKLRIHQDMLLPELEFLLPQELASLSSVLARLNPSTIIAHASSPLIDLVLERLGLSAVPLVSRKIQLSSMVLGATSGRWITPSPRTLHGWQLLCRVARQTQVQGHIFKVLHLDTYWKHAPRPSNIWPAPEVDTHSFTATGLLLFEAADCTTAWRGWAADHGLALHFWGEIPFQKQEPLCA